MDFDLPENVAAVIAAFERYERALVSNDVGTLDALFRDDPRTIRYGATENLYGYDPRGVLPLAWRAPCRRRSSPPMAAIMRSPRRSFAATPRRARWGARPRHGCDAKMAGAWLPATSA